MSDVRQRQCDGPTVRRARKELDLPCWDTIAGSDAGAALHVRQIGREDADDESRTRDDEAVTRAQSGASVHSLESCRREPREQ